MKSGAQEGRASEWNGGGAQLIQLLCAKWYWFLASVVLCLICVSFVLHNMTMVQNKYIAVVMVQEQKKTEYILPSDLSQNPHATYRPSWIKSLTYTPLDVKDVLNTTTLVEMAVQRSDVGVRYYAKSDIGLKRDIYNQTPLKVRFLDTPVGMTAFLVADLSSDGTGVRLSGFEEPDAGKKYADVVSASWGEVVATPLGRILVERDKEENHYPYHIKAFRPKRISIVKMSEEDAVREFDSVLEVTLSKTEVVEGKTIKAMLSASGSERRSLEFMNALLSSLEEALEQQMVHNLQSYEDRIERALVVLDSMPQDVALSQLRRQLQASQREVKIDRLTTQQGSLVSVVDRPRVAGKGIPSIALYAVGLLLGLLIPLAILYVYRALGKTILWQNELSSYWQQRLVGIIRGKEYRKGKDVSVFDDLRCLLGTKQKEGAKVIALLTPTHGMQNDAFMQGLAQNLSLSGLAVATVALQQPSTQGKKKEKSSAQTFMELTPGLLGSDAFCKTILEIKQRFDIVLVNTPGVDVSDAALLMAQLADYSVCVFYAQTTQLKHTRQMAYSLELRKKRVGEIAAVWVE